MALIKEEVGKAALDIAKTITGETGVAVSQGLDGLGALDVSKLADGATLEKVSHSVVKKTLAMGDSSKEITVNSFTSLTMTPELINKIIIGGSAVAVAASITGAFIAYSKFKKKEKGYKNQLLATEKKLNDLIAMMQANGYLNNNINPTGLKLTNVDPNVTAAANLTGMSEDEIVKLAEQITNDLVEAGNKSTEEAKPVDVLPKGKDTTKTSETTAEEKKEDVNTRPKELVTFINNINAIIRKHSNVIKSKNYEIEDYLINLEDFFAEKDPVTKMIHLYNFKELCAEGVINLEFFYIKTLEEVDAKIEALTLLL